MRGSSGAHVSAACYLFVSFNCVMASLLIKRTGLLLVVDIVAVIGDIVAATAAAAVAAAVSDEFVHKQV